MELPRNAEPRRRRDGFTILELAIALAMITVVSMFAIPYYYAQPAITLDNAATLLARDLRYAQNEAALLGVDTQVTFDLRGNGYAVQTAKGRALPNPVGGGDLLRVYSRDAVFEGVRIDGIDELKDAKLRFDRHGFCLDPASLELHYETEVRILHIDRDSGMVRIEGLTSSWTDDGM